MFPLYENNIFDIRRRISLKLEIHKGLNDGYCIATTSLKCSLDFYLLHVLTSEAVTRHFISCIGITIDVGV